MDRKNVEYVCSIAAKMIENGAEINKRQAKNGGAMISFELYENYDIKKFFKSLKLISLAESLGGVESLVCHPASRTQAP